MDKVAIYTDGACSGNPGPGGWGAVLMYKSSKKEISGSETETTNNRMELSAVIEGLKCLKRPCEVEVYSDSAYIVNAFNSGWIESWREKGWRNKSRDEVKNRDLWEELYQLTCTHSITWIKVKGHTDNEFNNRCDKMARKEIDKITEGRKSK